MSNPNEYDDAAFTEASNALIDAIGVMWDAGASEENIDNAVRDGKDNAGVTP